MTTDRRATHDLHYHYDGSISPEVVMAAFKESPHLREQALSLVDEAELKEPLADSGRFFERFQKAMAIFELSGSVYPLLNAQFAFVRAEGLEHLDLRFGCGALSSRLRIDESTVLDQFREAVDEARNNGLDVCPTLCLSRYESMERAAYLTEVICANLDFIRAVDLEGPESPHRTRDFGSIFRKLKELGLRVTIHAGEFSSSEAIWEALDECGAERIGHAFSARNDKALLKRLARDQIPIEVSLTSNHLLGLCPDLNAHPLVTLLEAGIPVVLCTDDRAIFRTSLTHEYRTAERILLDAGFNATALLEKVASDSRRYAFSGGGK